jgi:L-lactate dehydrogenase complex protein LldG
MTSAAPAPETYEAFKRRAGEARSVVHEFADWNAVAALALTLAREGRIAVSGPAAEAAGPVLLEDLGDRALAPGQEHRVTAGGAVGIVRGALGIAETGSVLLVEERSEDRAVSMLSPIVIHVVDRDQVYPTLDVLLEQLFRRVDGGPPTFASLSTGPSRTADIERSLTIGVHGPHDVHVVLLG